MDHRSKWIGRSSWLAIDFVHMENKVKHLHVECCADLAEDGLIVRELPIEILEVLDVPEAIGALQLVQHLAIFFELELLLQVQSAEIQPQSLVLCVHDDEEMGYEVVVDTVEPVSGPETPSYRHSAIHSRFGRLRYHLVDSVYG